MEFGFRAGDRRPGGSASSGPGGSPPARFSHPRDGYTGAQSTQGPSPSPLPTPLEWEAARREHIIREEVKRRLIEEEVRREFEAKGDLAFARGLHGGFGPDPFFAPDCFMPPMPMPMPMPMHPLPHAPPPVPFGGFGAWPGFGPPWHAGFGEMMPFPCDERRWSPRRPKAKHKLELLEIEPSRRPEALSPKSDVPRMKRKTDANAATTLRKKVQKLSKDWSCALCQVSATCEAGLNEHLGGRKHKAKLVQCGAIKAIKDDKNCSQTTAGNKNSTDPCDAPKKICMLVDGEMHEVVQKNNYLWCDRCRVRCDSNVIMAGHLRSKKHSKLNKVWTSIKAARTNADTKEGLASSCGSQINTNDSTEIPAVIEGDINMTTEVDESDPVENPVGKEITSMATEVESAVMATEVHENNPLEIPVETKKESTIMTNVVRQVVPKEE